MPRLLQSGELTKEELKQNLIFANVRNPYDRWVTYYARNAGSWLEYYEGVTFRSIERGKLGTWGATRDEAYANHARKFRRLRYRRGIIRALGFNIWMSTTLVRWCKPYLK